MKKYRQVDIPARTKEVVDEVLCDLCGKRIIENYGEVHDVEVRCRVGQQWPDGGNGKEAEFDICHVCFEKVLVPFLESNGAKPERKVWDY